jgi:hypothetical protein
MSYLRKRINIKLVLLQINQKYLSLLKMWVNQNASEKITLKCCYVGYTGHCACWYKHKPCAPLWSNFDLKQQLFIVAEVNKATPFPIWIKEKQHEGILVWWRTRHRNQWQIFSTILKQCFARLVYTNGTPCFKMVTQVSMINDLNTRPHPLLMENNEWDHTIILNNWRVTYWHSGPASVH